VGPWAAAGKAAGEQITNNPRLRVFSIQTDRARLLILLRRAADQQFVIAAGDRQSSVTVHHPPVTDQTYLVSASGVDRVESQRGGGIRIAFETQDVVSIVLLTSDPLAVNYVGRTSAAIRQETVLARREMLAQLLEETESTEKTLLPRSGTDSRNTQHLANAHSYLRRAAELQENRDSSNALQACNAAAEAIRTVRRSRWEQVVQSFTSPVASPFCVAYSTLPDHFRLRDQLLKATWGVDLLAGGEMEYLEHLLESGWKQDRPHVSGVSGDVQISLDGAHGGRSCLHLRAWPIDQPVVNLDGEIPVTISSPAMNVQAGQLLKVRGWAKVPQKLEGSWDGLMVYDSHSGPSLGERISETQGWREFTLYRAATATGEWQIHFALTGLGEAWIDDVSVTALANTEKEPQRLPQ
jgi:hypothetical protein